MINLEKFGIVFSNNTSNFDKDAAMNILNIHRLLEKEHYLGLPLMFGRSKRKEFKAIKDRLIAQTQGWGSKFLSRAGKAVLIQAVAQTIPLYVMNCFKLPKSFLHEMDILVARYW